MIILHFRNYIFYIRIINIQRVKILQIPHYFNFDATFNMAAASTILRQLSRQSILFTSLWSQAPTIKYHCPRTSFQKIHILYRIINIKRVKIFQIHHYFTVNCMLKITASNFASIGNMQRSRQLLTKILPTTPHKNSCMRLVLTRANYSADKVRNFSIG